MNNSRIEDRDLLRQEDVLSAYRLKKRAIRLAMISAVIQMLAKGIAGFATGSLAVLTTAADSLSDFLNAGIAWIAVSVGKRPPDLNHPFGHGKIEPLGALLQAFVILPLAIGLAWQGLNRLSTGAQIVSLGANIAVIMFSIVLGWWTGKKLSDTATKTDSLAIQGSGLSFSIDAVTHSGVLLALLIVEITGWVAADAYASLGMAFYVAFQTIQLAVRAIADLLDLQIPRRYRERVIMELEEHKDDFIDYHRLRTRRAGPEKHIDFHLTVCRYRTIEECHRLIDHLENAIEAIIPQSSVIIHMDPCEPGTTCRGDKICELAKERARSIPESDWPSHPTGGEAREAEREQHPFPELNES